MYPQSIKTMITLSSSLHHEELHLPFQLPASWLATHQVLAILTGGTESLFLEELKRGTISIEKPIYLIVSGQSNSLAASLEILTYIQSQGGEGHLLRSVEDIQEEVGGDELEVKGEPLRLGVIGEPSSWLIASYVDYEQVRRKMGVELINIPIEEVTSLGEVDGGLDGADKIYVRLKEIVHQYRLDGLTLRCFDLLTTVKNTGCIALSKLNDEGISAACEGDIPLLLTMMVARRKYGQPGFQVNPARIQADGRMLWAHCTVPLTMTTSHVLTTHFESGIGVGIHGELPLGQYRLMKLSADLKTLLDEPVELVANQYEDGLCRTQVWLQGTPELAERLLTHPLANHHLLVKVP